MRGKLLQADLQGEGPGPVRGGFLNGLLRRLGFPLGFLEEREPEFASPFHPQRCGVAHQAAHGAERLGAFRGGNRATGVEHVEGVTGFEDVGVGGNRQPCLHHAGGLRNVGLVEPPVRLDVGVVQVVAAHLVLLLAERLTVGDDTAVGFAGVGDVLEVGDALLRHQDAFDPVGQFHGNRVEVLPADLLEVGELGDLHAVEPHLPAESPGADGGLRPVVLDETHVVGVEVDPEGLQRPEVELLRVAGFGFQDHLELGVGLQPVRVLSVAGVVGTHGGFDVCDVPRFRSEDPQHGGGVHGAGPHFRVVGLPGQAAA